MRFLTYENCLHCSTPSHCEDNLMLGECPRRPRWIELPPVVGQSRGLYREEEACRLFPMRAAKAYMYPLEQIERAEARERVRATALLEGN